MAEVTNELMFDVLKWLPTNQMQLTESIVEVKTELRAMRGHVSAMQLDIGNLHSGQAKLELRLERIEQRLELADAHA